MKKKIVVIALSGGVDSSVAAFLLKKKGYKIIGLFMKNWNDPHVTLKGKCSWEEDSIDAMLVAQQIKIPFQIIDLSKYYKKYVLNYMFEGYKSGKTPNPDIICNRYIKFDIFLKKAFALKANYIATGHYVKKDFLYINGKKIYRLLISKDSIKDQSYFLCQLNQKQISKSIFPLGMFTKTEVRNIAIKAGLITANKKDSQGLCFIGKIKLINFLKKKLFPKRGKIIKISHKSFIYSFYKKKKYILNFLNEKNISFLLKPISYKEKYGKLIGYHPGYYYFTIGQRKGLKIGGYKKPLYIIDIDNKKNIIYTGVGKNHPGLYKKGFFIKNQKLHWIRKDMYLKNKEKMKVKCKIRYGQSLQKAFLYKIDIGLYIIFQTPQFAVTKGQFVVWYVNNELIGSGEI